MENIGLIYRKKDTFTDFNSVNDLLEPKLRKKIRIIILSIHFGLLAILLLWYLIANFLVAKKPQIIQVTLVTPKQAAFNPTPPSSKLAPPVVKPKKRRPKPKKKTIPKPKPKPRPRKKKTSYLKADQIKISRKEIKNDPVADLQPMSADDLQKELTKKYRNSRIKTKTNTQGNRSSAKMSHSYFDSISAQIYQTWNQPGKSELENRLPTVDIEFTVDGTGRITKARMLRKSGIPPMDISAARLLKDLKRFPRPPNGKTTFTVTLEISR